MCNHCYHKYGRNSNADSCPHPDRLSYAKGKCQNCYLNDYNKEMRKIKKSAKIKSDMARLNDYNEDKIIIDDTSNIIRMMDQY